MEVSFAAKPKKVRPYIPLNIERISTLERIREGDEQAWFPIGSTATHKVIRLLNSQTHHDGSFSVDFQRGVDLFKEFFYNVPTSRGELMKTAIAYIRASTDPTMQKNSIAIQTAIIERFCEQHGYSIEETYVEYQSGADDERKEFNAALTRTIEEGATLITWKVDRLSRSLSIFAKIQDHLPLIRFCELGDAEVNIMVLSVLLGVAHQERVNTSIRVKAAYKHLKAENPNLKWGNPTIMQTAHPAGLRVRQENAHKFNTRIQAICEDLGKAGYCNRRQMAVQLNSLGLTTRRGRPFTKENLKRVLNYRR